MAAAEHFVEVLLVGHVGKLVKLAGGIMNTHSRCADCRTELFCAHAALCGADAATCRALMDAATTDACLDILDAAQLREPVMASLLTAIQLHLDRRAAGAFKVGAVLFSNRNGPLGQDKNCRYTVKIVEGSLTWYILWGSGPGAPDLITRRGAALLQTADCIIYAGSLVNPALLGLAGPDCAICNSAEMTLEQVLAVMKENEAAHKTTVRLHTGDPCLYGAIREQMDALDAMGIAYDDTPGVSSFCGAAAALNAEYTLPGVSQTVIITRMEGRTPVPEGERLAALAAHGATMVIFLSIGLIDRVQVRASAGRIHRRDPLPPLSTRRRGRNRKLYIAPSERWLKAPARQASPRRRSLLSGTFWPHSMTAVSCTTRRSQRSSEGGRTDDLRVHCVHSAGAWRWRSSWRQPAPAAWPAAVRTASA